MASATGTAPRRWGERETKHEHRRREATAGGIPLGSVGGVRIVADWSLLLIFALVTFQLGAGALPAWHPDWGTGLRWALALAAAVLFFASIVLHELSHALVARMNGIPVHRITLFLFGGMAHMEGEPPSPKAELLMAAVGPLVSLALGVGATALGLALAGPSLELMARAPELAYSTLGPIPTLLLWLGPVNVVLALFNLVPGFPLDGGRVLRALLWGATGDLRKATRWASAAGRFFGLTLVALGVFSLLGGNVGQGIWLVLIGWFLSSAARAGYQQVVVREALDGVPVSLVMRARVGAVHPALPVDRLVYDYIMTTDQQGFPVVEGDRLVGLVAMEDVRRVPRDEWAQHTVREIMTPGERLVTIDESEPASHALERLARHDVEQVPVVHDGRLIGLVRRQDLMKWLAMNEPGLPA